jgi:hypothetical protein
MEHVVWWMPTVSSAMVLAAALAALMSGVRVWHRRRLQPLQRRIEQLTQAHLLTNELLRRARQQSQALQSALDLARVRRVLPAEPVLASRDLFLGLNADHRHQHHRAAHAFADTTIESRPSDLD